MCLLILIIQPYCWAVFIHHIKSLNHRIPEQLEAISANESKLPSCWCREPKLKHPRQRDVKSVIIRTFFVAFTRIYLLITCSTHMLFRNNGAQVLFLLCDTLSDTRRCHHILSQCSLFETNDVKFLQFLFIRYNFFSPMSLFELVPVSLNPAMFE